MGAGAGAGAAAYTRGQASQMGVATVGGVPGGLQASGLGHSMR